MSDNLIIGVFKAEIRAESAASALRDAGINNDQILYSRHSSEWEMNNTLDHLLGMGVSEEEVSYYKSELQAGHSLVVVQHQGLRSETLAVFLLNGAKNHKYLRKIESANAGLSNISPSVSIGSSDQDEVGRKFSANISSEISSTQNREQLTQDELASLRNLLEGEGLGHLL